MNPPHRILVVGNDLNVRRLIEVALQRARLDVTAVPTHPDTFGAIRRGEVGLLIFDLLTGGPEEYELLAERATDPILCSVPMIIVTTDDDFDQLQALKYGVFVVLRKPFDPELLQTFAASALSRLPPPHQRVVKPRHSL